MSYTRPDVYVEETLSQPFRRSALLSTPLPTFIGETRRGPTEFTIVESWSQFNSVFGGFSVGGGDSDLAYAVHNYFRLGAKACAIQRVVADAAALATINIVDRDATTPVDTLRVDAKTLGDWSNSVKVGIVDKIATEGIFDFLVYDGGDTSTYMVERYTDVSMDPANPRYLEKLVNSATRGSNYVRVTDLGSATAAPDNTPAAGTYDLTGGDYGVIAEADYISGVDAIDNSAASLLVNIPGEERVNVLNAALALAQGRKDSFVIIDPPGGLDGDSVVAFAETLTETSYGAVYWPWITVADAAVNRGGARKTLPPGGAVMGVFANNDAAIGPFKTPAGRGARIPGVLELQDEPTQAELGFVNAGHVNALRTFPGDGTVVYGGRTLKRAGNDKYISLRRSMIYLNASLTELVSFAVFESNDETTWDIITEEVTRFLENFWNKGGLRGRTPEEAFFVVCDESNNPLQKVQEGILTVEVGVSLQRPAEFIVIKLGQFESGEITVEEVI